MSREQVSTPSSPHLCLLSNVRCRFRTSGFSKSTTKLQHNLDKTMHKMDEVKATTQLPPLFTHEYTVVSPTSRRVEEVERHE